MVRPANDGQFQVHDLPPGDYFVTVVTTVDPDELLTPAFFEELVPGAMRVTLGEGERRIQDIQLARQ